MEHLNLHVKIYPSVNHYLQYISYNLSQNVPIPNFPLPRKNPACTFILKSCAKI